MSLYGGMSKGERNRIKVRVRAAMAAQAATEGRFLGGRPPYGYELGDAGPHPNPGKAAMGARLHQLEPDPIAAPVVRRVFEEYVAGKGLMAIAEGLTADGILSPSAHDPARNRHRASSGGAWSKGAVRAILDNPRYTGRQVWNRQRRDEVLVDVEGVALSHETKMRWNDRADWVLVRRGRPRAAHRSRAVRARPGAAHARRQASHDRATTTQEHLRPQRARPLRHLRARHAKRLGARPPTTGAASRPSTRTYRAVTTGP